MQYATKKQLLEAVKEENFSWLGWRFWEAFLLLPKSNRIRKYHSEIWESLSKDQQEECEHSC